MPLQLVCVCDMKARVCLSYGWSVLRKLQGGGSSTAQHAYHQAEWAEKTANCAGEFKGAPWQEMNAKNLELCKRVIKEGLPVNSGKTLGVPLVTVDL